MSKENKPQEDTAIVFLKEHRHGGKDYKADDMANISADYADILINQSIAKLLSPATSIAKVAKEGVK